MNEDILVDDVVFSETGMDDTESGLSDTESGENAVESGADIGDSGDAGSLSEPSESVTVFPDIHFNEELGGYPVVLVEDMTQPVPYASYSDYYMPLPTQWLDYFSGIMAQKNDSDYVAFCFRDYVSSSYGDYTDHYKLYYDVAVDNGSLVAGEYPCIDVYRVSGNEYVCNETVASISSVPFPAYGSFGSLSDLRKGVSHNEMWAVLFAIGFAVVYSVCHDVFDYVMQHVYRHR